MPPLDYLGKTIRRDGAATQGGATIRRRAKQQGYVAEYFDGGWTVGWAFLEARVGNYVTDRQCRLTDDEALEWLDENY